MSIPPLNTSKSSCSKSLSWYATYSGKRSTNKSRFVLKNGEIRWRHSAWTTRHQEKDGRLDEGRDVFQEVPHVSSRVSTARSICLWRILNSWGRQQCDLSNSTSLHHLAQPLNILLQYRAPSVPCIMTFCEHTLRWCNSFRNGMQLTKISSPCKTKCRISNKDIYLREDLSSYYELRRLHVDSSMMVKL